MIDMNNIANQLLNNSQLMQNPIFANASQAYRNHDSTKLRTIAENMCKEHGVTYDEMRKRMGLNK